MKLTDSFLKQIIVDPKVQQKLEIAIRLKGENPLHDPWLRLAQFHVIHEGLKDEFRAKHKARAFDGMSFEGYAGTDAFDEQADAYADQKLYEMGFSGFDDHETEYLLPLAALGMAGKIAPKIGTAVKAIGKKVGQLLKSKKKKEAEKAAAAAASEAEQQRLNAIQSGIPANIVNASAPSLVPQTISMLPQAQQTYGSYLPKELPSVASVNIDPIIQQQQAQGTQLDKLMSKTDKLLTKMRDAGASSEELLQVGAKINEKIKESQGSTLDKIKTAFQEFKDSEKQKEIKNMLPTIIIVALILFFLGWFIAKKM